MSTNHAGQLPERAAALELQPADILLVHSKNSFWGRLIRWGTHCYWNHALLVYSAADPEQGKESPLVIDAKTSGNIALGRADYYLEQLHKYDLGVRRFDVDWFQQESVTSEGDIRGRICNLAANEVEFKLGSRLGEMVDQLFRQATLILRFLRRRLFGPKPPPQLPWNLRLIDFKAFTCGGFVQWCYYKAVTQVIKEQGLDKSKLGDVLFNSKVGDKATPFELLTTTPADLANCRQLSWKYIIKDGRLAEFSDQQAAVPIG
jgi:hypothetical protein